VTKTTELGRLYTYTHTHIHTYTHIHVCTGLSAIHAATAANERKALRMLGESFVILSDQEQQDSKTKPGVYACVYVNLYVYAWCNVVCVYVCGVV
jgi:hypothetical protein